jgi:glycosyltransferase involved in cell wall biosynthesis
MNIGIDARPLLPPLTGIGRYLYGFLETLQRKDRENRYFLFCHRPLEFPLLNSRWRIVHGGCIGRLQSTAWMQAAVPRHARRLGLDLFWAPRHHLPLRLPKQTAAVVTIHDLVNRRYPGTMSPSNLILERLLMGPSLRRADRVLVPSHGSRDELFHFFPHSRRKIRVISPGVPSFPASPPVGSPPPKPYFLAVGTREPRKNLARVIAAFLQMETEGAPAHLVIAGGTGWKHQETDHWIRGMRAADQRDRTVHLLGYVERSQLPELYREAVALVFPSVYEGFGLPILEAMSMGTPVITANCSAMPEVCGSAAIQVNPFSVSDIRGAMERLIKPESRKTLAERSQNRAKRFSWEQSTERLLRVFREAVERRAGLL